MKSANLSENQIRAKNYLEKHGIEDIIADMVNTITHVQMPDPIIFMIKFLAQLHANPIELQQKGLHLTDKQLISPVLCIPIPQFAANCKNLFQQSLDKEQFLKCKNNYTKEKNNLRQVLKISMEYPKSKVGLFLVDPDCYTAFEPIIRPILAKNNKNVVNVIYQKNQTLDQTYSCLSLVSPFIEECYIKMKRNQSDKMFNNLLNPRQRSEILESISAWLTKSKFSTFEIDKISNDDAKKLVQVHEKLLKRESANNLASLLSSLKKGPRFPDWPRNRAISISSDKSTLVWINKEDQLLYKVFQNKNVNLLDCLKKAFTFSEEFDKEFISAFSERYGYLNVKPQDSGLGLFVILKFKIDVKDSQQFKSNVKTMNNNYFSIKQQGKDSKWILQSDKTSCLNKVDFYKELEKIMVTLFQGIFKFPVEALKHSEDPVMISISSHVAIIIKDLKSPEEEQINIESEDQFNQFEPMEIEPEVQMNFDKVKDISLYTDKLKQIKSYLSSNYEIPELPFKTSKLALSLNDDVIYHSLVHKDLIIERFYVCRRNIDHLPFVSNDQANQYLRQFIDQQHIQEFNVRDCREPTIKKNAVSFMLLHGLQIDQFLATHIYEPQLLKLPKESKFFKQQKEGRSVKHDCDRITILTNQNDHFTFIYRIDKNSMSQELEEFGAFLEDFETFLKLKNLNFAEHPDLGYLTSQVKYCGKGLSLVYCLPQKLSLDNANLKISSAMQCHQDDRNSCQFLELLQITQESMRQFCNIINKLLTAERSKVASTSKDVFPSQIDCIENFTLFYEQCEARLKTQLQSLPDHIKNNIQMQNTETFDDELFDKILREHKINVPSKTQKATVKFVISRNFDKYKYCQFLPLYDLQDLQKKVEGVLISQDLGFIKVSKSETTPEQIVNGYQHKTYHYIYINSCANHHIQVFGQSKVSDLIVNLQRVSEILKKLQKAISQFSKKNNLGYLGPTQDQTFMSGIQFQVVLEVSEKTIKDITPICGQFSYEMVKCDNDNVFDEYINEDDEEITDIEKVPLLGSRADGDDYQNYEEMSWLYKLIPMRPGHLIAEIEFFNQIF